MNSLHKDQWRGALMFSLICIWINGWVNNCEPGDLRCYYAHYNVIVMVDVQDQKFVITASTDVPAHDVGRQSTATMLTTKLTHLPLDKMATIFLISNKISLKYFPWGLIDNRSALVQIMAWCRPGAEPLFETILTQFTDALSHICDTRGRWVNSVLLRLCHWGHFASIDLKCPLWNLPRWLIALQNHKMN